MEKQKQKNDVPMCADCKKIEVVKPGRFCTKCQIKRVSAAWTEKIVFGKIVK
jgi:ribosomal protein L37AE/L43A